MARKKKTKEVEETFTDTETQEQEQAHVEETQEPVEETQEQEPVVEETPVSEETVTKPTIDANSGTGKLTNEQIKALLVDDKLTGIEKLETIAKGAVTKYAIIASKMLGYNETMFNNPKLNIATGVAKQYDLLNTIKSIVNTEDYNDFKMKYDIMNTAFRDLKDQAFADRYVYRYEQEWKWGKKDLKTLQHMLLLLLDLSDGRTRAQNKKRIDFNAVLSKDEITLGDKAIENIKKYYN